MAFVQHSKICDCGNTFRAKYAVQTKCSRGCKGKPPQPSPQPPEPLPKPPRKRCQVCGSVLPRFCSSYCGKDCRKAFQSLQSRTPRRTIQCKHCGTSFHGKGSQRYCNHACRDHAKMKRAEGPSQPKPTIKPTATCKHCGKVFELKSPNTKCCSRVCGARFRNGHQYHKPGTPFQKQKKVQPMKPQQPSAARQASEEKIRKFYWNKAKQVCDAATMAKIINGDLDPRDAIMHAMRLANECPKRETCEQCGAMPRAITVDVAGQSASLCVTCADHHANEVATAVKDAEQA